MTVKELVAAYYALSDPRKIRAWHIEKELAIDLFESESHLSESLMSPRLPCSRPYIQRMLECGEGRILGHLVILSDKPGVALEIEL